jgi:hypothetical protein
VDRRSLLVASIALAALACRDRTAAPPDAGNDGGRNDAANPLTLVVAVTGCATYQAAGGCTNPEAPCCTGAPPLTLSFVPVGSPELSQFRWTFGDGTPPTTERAPSHVYAHPGEYLVTVVGGSSEVGMVNPPHPLQVAVKALAAGVPCDVDGQCGDGLLCLCAPGAGCSPAFTRGLCSKVCETEPCGADAVCAALNVGPPVDAGTRPPLCIAACQTSAQCPAGYVCQTVPTGSTAEAEPWTRGCLPLGAARDLGGPCRDANEQLDNDACATRVCADIGALGACSVGCDDTHPCPDGAGCALIGGGRQLCLRSGCGSDADCAPDPLLTCGPLQPASGDAIVTVCAPKRCTGDAACAPSGRCGADGFCIRR